MGPRLLLGALVLVFAPRLAEARFARLMRGSRLRLFVLSPMFTNGGDSIRTATVNGSVSSSLRLINLLRREPGRRTDSTAQ
jgi:hypothetical protein